MSDTGIVDNPQLELVDAGENAKRLFGELSDDISIVLPEIDLNDPKYDLGNTEDDPIYKEVDRLTNEDLTTRVIGGAGTFDALMQAYTAHLKQEYDKGRISGSDYARAYIELTATAMGQSVQYLLGRDQAYWAAMLTQQQAKMTKIQGITALVGLAQAKTELAITEIRAKMDKAEYALSKLRLSSEEANHDNIRLQHEIEKFKLQEMLPIEKENMIAQGDLLVSQKGNMDYQTNFIMPKQVESLVSQVNQTNKQIEKLTSDIDLVNYQIQNVLPAEVDGIIANTNLTIAQGDLLVSQKGNMDYQTNFIMPKQVESLVSQIGLTDKQIEKLISDIDLVNYQIENVLPAEVSSIIANTNLTIARRDVTEVEKDKALFELNTFLPVQVSQTNKQIDLITSQIQKSNKEVDILNYTLVSMMPVQRDQVIAQNSQINAATFKIEAEKEHVVYQTQFTLPAQRLNIEADTNIKSITATDLLPAQVANTVQDTGIKAYTKEFLLPSQKKVTDEQAEAKRAETLNVRFDGATVAGSIGKQKDLYTQQITSFQRDGEVKAAKMFMDAWVTQKTLDENLDAPNMFKLASINEVMTKIKTVNGLS